MPHLNWFSHLNCYFKLGFDWGNNLGRDILPGIATLVILGRIIDGKNFVGKDHTTDIWGLGAI